MTVMETQWTTSGGLAHADVNYPLHLQSTSIAFVPIIYQHHSNSSSFLIAMFLDYVQTSHEIMYEIAFLDRYVSGQEFFSVYYPFV